jgi:hypothetical protein
MIDGVPEAEWPDVGDKYVGRVVAEEGGRALVDSTAFFLRDAARVAPDGEVIPNFEVVFPEDEYDRHSLEEAVEAEFGGRTLRIGPLELQIAYKLRLGSQKDFEDALHLYTVFGDRLDTEELERFVDGLDVADQYERLRDT